LVVFVEADVALWDGAGSLASVTLRRPRHSYRALTGADQGLFHSPSPLPDGCLLVSRRSGDGADTHGVCVFDPDQGRIESFFDDPQWHDIQAKAVYARPEPDGRATAVPEEAGASARTAKFYCLNVYATDLDPSWLPPGSVKQLRVLEGVAVRSDAVRRFSSTAVPAVSTTGILPVAAQGQDAPGDSWAGRPCYDALTGTLQTEIPALAQRRILGEVPIRTDGSFNIEIPANTPIELQILDSDGMALRSCGWVWAKDYARQGCIGCHEDPELTPENVMVEALQHPSVPLTLPPAERRTVNFRRDIMPIVAAKCVRCHAGAGSPLRLTKELSPVARTDGPAHFNRTYESLLTPGRYVHPGKARTSPLIWRLYGRNTSRPWDTAGPVKPSRRMPPEGAPALTEQEKRTFVEWIDLGALWDGLPPVAASASEDRSEGASK
jgi:hypothetical protein